jgi:hypothetical protein
LVKNSLMIFLIGLALLLSACQTNPTPQEFISKPGRFSVTAARPFKETVQSNSSAAGKLATHQFNAELENRTDIVSYTDYPVDFINQNDPEKILDGASIGAVAVLNGSFVSASKITLEGNPGREIMAVVKTPNGQSLAVKAHLYLVKNRLYMVLTAAKNGQVSSTEIDAFLSSFKLLTP